MTLLKVHLWHSPNEMVSCSRHLFLRIKIAQRYNIRDIISHTAHPYTTTNTEQWQRRGRGTAHELSAIDLTKQWYVIQNYSALEQNKVCFIVLDVEVAGMYVIIRKWLKIMVYRYGAHFQQCTIYRKKKLNTSAICAKSWPLIFNSWSD